MDQLIKAVNKQLIMGKDITYAKCHDIALSFINPVNEVAAGSFLSLLTIKGVTLDELLGMHKAVYANRTPISVTMPVVDIVGTGGDGSGSINISTASALLTAACGVPVVKHGNRAVSSYSGAADVLQALGYNINLNPKQVVESLAQDNFAFCFAPNFYPAFAKLALIRQQLGIATVFNLLGPLLNPVGLDHVLLGVYDSSKLDLMAQALVKLGTEKSLVVHGNQLDELSCIGITEGRLVSDGKITNITIDPSHYGLRKCNMADLAGGDAYFNAQIIATTLNGKDTPLTDTLILNAGVALYLYCKVASIADGVAQSQARIKQGSIVRSNKLSQILLRKHAEVRPLKKKSLKQALLAQERAIIAEIKRASPSAGKIAMIEDLALQAQKYVAAGATAISVLTDSGFAGDIEDLKQVSIILKDTAIPVLRKDFIFNVRQIAESAAAGADAILLIVAAVGDNAEYLVKVAHEFGLEVLLEVHNANELAIALNAKADLIGVNQRNLNDFSLHPERFAELIVLIPKDVAIVAESGIKVIDDAKLAFALGYNAVLIGEALSLSTDPQLFLKNCMEL